MTALCWLLDTNIVSYFLRRSSPGLEARMAHALGEQSAAISVLTRAELRDGQAAMAADDRRRKLIDQFLLQLPCLPWTDQAADHYGSIRHEHRRLGTPIGELDTQIAAHAVAEGLVLVTHNVRHFERVSQWPCRRRLDGLTGANTAGFKYSRCAVVRWPRRRLDSGEMVARPAALCLLL